MIKRHQVKVSAEALRKHAEDSDLAAKFDDLLAAAREAERELRDAEVRRMPVTDVRRLALRFDAALTDAMRAGYAAERAAIGPRGYDDRIFRRKAKAKPGVRALTAEAERLLTLRESHRLNGIPPAPLDQMA